VSATPADNVADTADTVGDMSGRTMDRVTVAEAADRLGVTRDAIRKRVKRGSIEWDAGTNGEVFVYVDASATSNDTAETNGDKSEDVSGHAGSSALVESLQDQVEYLRREVEIWQDEARRKDHLLAAALERIPAIVPPPDAPNHNVAPEAAESPVTSSEPATNGDVPPEQERRERGWWGRLFFGEN
jgi:hypothetical protein